jgi:hypothetical protein
MVASPQALFLPHLPAQAKPGGTGAKDGERYPSLSSSPSEESPERSMAR